MVLVTATLEIAAPGRAAAEAARVMLKAVKIEDGFMVNGENLRGNKGNIAPLYIGIGVKR